MIVTDTLDLKGPQAIDNHRGIWTGDFYTQGSLQVILETHRRIGW